MAIDDELVEALRAQIGVERVRERGVVSALLIRRYARAIGDDNPVHYDSGYARRRGYEDVVAPPNLVSSITAWDEGAPDVRARAVLSLTLPAP